MAMAVVSAPGKINLTLDILGRRADGYHEMEMLMHAVSLENTVYLTGQEESGIRLDCSNPAVPAGENNLAYRAAQTFFSAWGHSFGLELRVEKRVPMEAGMAGGSADAAGVLIGLNALAGDPFSAEELCQIGLGLGADVPFCIVGGAALVQGIGERITPLPPLGDGWLAIVKPAAGVKTAGCFAAYDALASVRRPDTPQALAALQKGDLPALGLLLENVLEQAAALPEVPKIRENMLKSGALGSRMTGSGSAVYGLFAEKKQALRCARRMYQFGGSFFLARPVGYGAKLLYLG
ncbi:MAG: 4-(cytidine 5'-diphospho)-2-C-methyl-D-erythritol kinase [Oscillospiraceae bacterium]|nr:4-(cytidine 5'-diphospho)-2-C-methyl-D-erythritol kinase [Oscillospiraceae bacterium]